MSDTAALVALAEGGFKLSGALTADTVPQLWRQSAQLRAAGYPLISLASVERADSAGLALLVAWQGQASAAGKRIRFESIPPRLLAVARISEAEDLLGAG